MENIESIIKELIPPSNYFHRNGFTNYRIVDSLLKNEKSEVEKELIKMLENSDDWLIGETLSYMKSKNSIPVLKEKLEKAKKANYKILWANAIYKINGNRQMADIALQEFGKIKDKYELIGVFRTLSEFRDARINDRIKSYQNHDDYLVSYNAQRVLPKNTNDLGG